MQYLRSMAFLEGFWPFIGVHYTLVAHRAVFCNVLNMNLTIEVLFPKVPIVGDKIILAWGKAWYPTTASADWKLSMSWGPCERLACCSSYGVSSIFLPHFNHARFLHSRQKLFKPMFDHVHRNAKSGRVEANLYHTRRPSHILHTIHEKRRALYNKEVHSC